MNQRTCPILGSEAGLRLSVSLAGSIAPLVSPNSGRETRSNSSKATFLGRYAIVLDECIDRGFCFRLCPVACIQDARTQGIVEGAGGYTRNQRIASLGPLPCVVRQSAEFPD